MQQESSDVAACAEIADLSHYAVDRDRSDMLALRGGRCRKSHDRVRGDRDLGGPAAHSGGEWDDLGRRNVGRRSISLPYARRRS